MSWPENHHIHDNRRSDSATSLSLAALPQILRISSTASGESNTYGSSKSGPWSPFDRHKHQRETELPAGVITCAQCTKPFRGLFQQGNLARHIKHSHGAVDLKYPCFVSGCNKSYKRTDARLKHIRKQHNESHFAPMSDHKEVDGVEIVAVGSHFDEPKHLHSSSKAKCAAHQGPPPTQLYARSSTEAMSELHIARMVLTALYNDLGDEYPAYIAHYLSSWSRKVEQMRLDRSRHYAAYRQSLTDVETVVSIIDSDSDAQNHRVHASQQTTPHRKNSLAAGSSAGGRLSKGQISKGKGRAIPVRNKSKSFGQTSVSLKDNARDAKAYSIGCPCHQRWLLRRNIDLGVDHPCTGCAVTYMSEIRTHLRPKRAMRNHPEILYYSHCMTCKRDFVDEQTCQDHLEYCLPRTMKQGDILAQWIPLCQTLFPYDELVPSPYIGDNSPLDQELVDRYRIIHSNQAHPLPSFLDQAIQGLNGDWMSSDQQHVFPPPQQSTTAINHLLSDLVGPYVAGYGTESGRLAQFAAETNDLNMRLTNGQCWQDYLDEGSRFVANANQSNNLPPNTNHLALALPQELFAETALSVGQPDAISDTALDAVSQHDGYQQLRASSYHGAGQNQYGVPLYSTPVSFRSFPPFYDQLAGATTMSTQTSSQGWNPDCSSYMVSSWTSPASNIESYDCTSLRSVGVPETPRLRHAQPSSKSLCEEPVTDPHGTNPANAASWSAQQPFFASQVVPEANHQNEAASRMPFWSA